MLGEKLVVWEHWTPGGKGAFRRAAPPRRSRTNQAAALAEVDPFAAVHGGESLQCDSGHFHGFPGECKISECRPASQAYLWLSAAEGIRDLCSLVR